MEPHPTSQPSQLRGFDSAGAVAASSVRPPIVPPSSSRSSHLPLEPDCRVAVGDIPLESAKELEAKVKALKALVAELNKRVNDLKMKENAVPRGSLLKKSGSAGAASSSYSGKDNRKIENEKERTRLRKPQRRVFTRRLLAGLRQFGNFSIPPNAAKNDVLAALAREAGWIVESDGTTYRHSPSTQNQQNSGSFSARSGENPLSSSPLKKCSQEGKHRNGKLSFVHATPTLPVANVDHGGAKEIYSKGYSDAKFSEVVGRRRNGFYNRSKEGQPDFRNGSIKDCYTIFIENLPEKIHWKKLGSIFGSHGQVIDAFIPKKETRMGVSLAKHKPRQSYWRKSSKVVHSKSGLEVFPTIKHCEVEGVVDADKLHVLSNCLVGWCKNFIKIDSNSLRCVKDEKLETLAEWFSRVETWSESLVVESRRVWLVCEGIPFHAWNWDTFKNIATKWGKLIAIDNSCEFPSSFDRAKIQILTNAQVRINELLELKVGDHLFKILVHEVDPSFKPNSWVPEDCDISLDLDPPIGL
ncbi:hypothetical protein F3Y22_tig00110503pilonHSYRG00362 [Hibiscus syriacus]|uniref:Protein BZR1 homolog n=1 Tax=Hibiscus syriacus TaxID=106335 RepID=A0A6A3AGI3_HIBSY|nr:hypothetical protein F3Y22_tig00110503pilonHSYRG00362 [Hibiscus syriacus]